MSSQAPTEGATGVAARVEGRQLGVSQEIANRLLFGARRIAAAILFVELIFAVTASASDYRNVAVSWVLLAAGLVALLYVLYAPAPTTAVMIACGVIAVAQLANIVPTDGTVEAAAVIGWLRLSAWMIALSFGLRRSVIGLSVVVVCAWVALLSSSAVGGQLATSWYPITVLCAAGFASAVGLASACTALDYAAKIEDLSAQEQLDAQRAKASAIARRQETSRIGWSLHDTVVNTLHAIATGIPEDQLDLVRGRCARDVAAIDEWRSRPGSTDASPVEAKEIGHALQREASTLGVQLTVETQEGVCEIPRDVLDAAVGALRESLVNVAKHAPHASVGLQVELRPESFSIGLNDDGPGFTREATDTRGISSSIIARCEQRGISATVNSVPGAGTTVTLEWHRKSPDIPASDVVLPEPQVGRLQDAVRSVIAAALLWIVLLCLGPVLLSATWREFALKATAWLLIAVAAVGCAWALRTAHRVSRWWLLAVAASTMFASFCYATGESSTSQGLEVWAYAPGLLGIVVVAAATQRISRAVFTWLCGVVGVIAGLGSGFFQLIAAHPAESVALLNIIPLAVVVWVLHRFAGGVRAAQDYHETATSLVLADHLAAQEAARNERLAFADALTSPFMRAIADGTADPRDPECQDRALELERLARTIATIPSLGPRTERLLMDLAVFAFERDRRLRVGVMAVFDKDIPLDLDDSLVSMFEWAVAAARVGGYLTLSARVSFGNAELTLVWDSESSPPDSTTPAFDGLTVSVDAEQEQSVAFVQWSVPQADQERTSIHATT